MVQPSFRKAAIRHHRDAVHLRASSYLANADHLSGFAAECALKALVVEYLGGSMSGSFPMAKDGTQLRQHIGPGLWGIVSAFASGHPEPQVVALFQNANPFDDWTVSDRYAEGTHLAVADVDAHIRGARRAIEALEAAAISMNHGGS